MELTEKERARWEAFKKTYSRDKTKKHCENLKYIDNRFLNSDNRGYKGFSLVGRHKVTGNWRIIKVWGEW